MAIAMRGLRLKPSYEQLIGVAVSDELRNIKFPNRDAKFLRDGFVLSQLDGEGHREMERQQEMASKEAYKEQLLKQLARNNSDNISHHSFRTANDGDLRNQRINNMLHNRASEALQNNNTEFYDISDNTAEGGTQTVQLPGNEGGTQTDQLSINEGATQTDQLPHVEDHRMQIEALQQEAYNREAWLLANHEQNLRQVQQDLRSRFYEVSGNARRREIEDQTIIDELVNRVNQQSRVISEHERIQAITDQQRLQAIEDQQRLQAIEDQQQLQAIEDQPASSSTDPSHLFGKSATGLLTIKGKTKGGWGKANKAELQGVLRDFNISFDTQEPNHILRTRVANIFESHGG
jgi:hypothetical protein